MSSPVHSSGSESPLSTLSHTPSLPNSPSNTPSETIRATTPASPVSLTRVKFTSKGNSASPPVSPTRTKFTSDSVAIAATTKAKAKEHARKKEDPNEGKIIETPTKNKRGRPRKRPLPEKKKSNTTEVAVLAKVLKPIAPKSVGAPVKRKRDDLSIDMNDQKLTTISALPTKPKIIPSTSVNDPPTPPAKKARSVDKTTTPPKTPKGLVEATRASTRPKKLSPKAREALGVMAPPPEEDNSGLEWGFQESGDWKEPKLMTKADHEREKKERELAKVNSKGISVKNRSCKMTVRQWKEKFGAKLPESDYGEDVEGTAAKENGEESLDVMKELKLDEEEWKEISEFYKKEMAGTHTHPEFPSSPSFHWHHSHTQQAPESNVRTYIPEAKWKTEKYEKELAGKFDNYSAPFRHFWKEPEVIIEESNVRGG